MSFRGKLAHLLPPRRRRAAGVGGVRPVPAGGRQRDRQGRRAPGEQPGRRAQPHPRGAHAREHDRRARRRRPAGRRGAAVRRPTQRCRRALRVLRTSTGAARIAVVRSRETVADTGGADAVFPAFRRPGRRSRPLRRARWRSPSRAPPTFARRVAGVTGLDADRRHARPRRSARRCAACRSARCRVRRGTVDAPAGHVPRRDLRRARVRLAGLARDRARAGRRSSRASSSRAASLIVLLLLGFMLVALTLAWFLARSLHGQLAGFLEAARRIGAGDYASRVPTIGHDDFAALGEEFNKMSARARGARAGPRRSSASGCAARCAASARRSPRAWTATACSRSRSPRCARASPPTPGARGRARSRRRPGGRRHERRRRGRRRRDGGRRGAGVRRRRVGARRRRPPRRDRAAAAHPRRRARRLRLDRPPRAARSPTPSASCSATSPSRPRSRWRTSTCTRSSSARRSRTG